MLKLLLIFVGSGVGGVLRYALAGWVQNATRVDFPAGTLIVNVTGCLLIGLLTAAFSGPILIREEYRVAILVGVLGGYTTFSTFGLETFQLVNEAEFVRAGFNILLSVAAGLVGVWLGYRLAESWVGV